MADLDFMINRYVRPQTRTRANACTFADEAARADNHVIAKHCARLDHRIGTNGNMLTQSGFR
ncbi:hypothetical protein D3C79_877610 [compost metagenome]